ncbi:hypothetical protein D3C86_1858010 [compost metagenome]
MGSAVFVETHFTGERQAKADVLCLRFSQLNAGRRDLLSAEGQVPCFAFTFGVFAAGCHSFGGMLGDFIGVRVSR